MLCPSEIDALDQIEALFPFSQKAVHEHLPAFEKKFTCSQEITIHK